MKKKRVREDLRPDLTPLMDVMFLLIIFFIVTTVFKKNESLLDLTLPTADGRPNSKENPKSILLELSEKGFAVNGKKSSFKDFSKYCASLSNSGIPVDLRIDKKVVYDRVVKVLAILQENNLSNLSLITELK